MFWFLLALKILQSDWPRAFLYLIREPDFSETCGFNRIIKVIMVHDLNAKSKKPYFWGVFGHYPRNGIFFQKIQLRQLFSLKASYPHEKFRKNPMGCFGGNAWWWNRTIPFPPSDREGSKNHLKGQSCKLNNNKYMIASTQMRNTGIFSYIALLGFKLLSRKVLFINRKDHGKHQK